MSIEEIIKVLRVEALEDPETGWLSDLGSFELEYDSSGQAIELVGWGSIDLGHLAGIVHELIERATRDT